MVSAALMRDVVRLLFVMVGEGRGEVPAGRARPEAEARALLDASAGRSRPGRDFCLLVRSCVHTRTDACDDRGEMLPAGQYHRRKSANDY